MIYGLTRRNETNLYYIYLSEEAIFGCSIDRVFPVYSTIMVPEEHVILE